jgi:glycosyltransferase involved in cell wall biosynthesis
MRGADLLLFTSRETVELVMRKYPSEWASKARVLPHSFDPSLYARGARDRSDEQDRSDERDGSGEHDGEIVVRYTGEFYGRRTPRPLVETLRAILQERPRLLEGVRFELIGPVAPGVLEQSGFESLPRGLVQMRPPVNYAESLALTSAADGLLIVDAPAERSVFLPSKLVDYIGAARPILGLTPPGASDELIRRLGGWAADPSDAAAMLRATEAFLAFLSQNRNERRPWGDAQVRAAYEARAVAGLFETMLRELLD